MMELELRDIHLPDTSLWWPPAPGWWILTGFLLIAIFVITWMLRRLKRKPIKSVSLLEIDHIRREIKQGQSEKAALQALSALMRRIVISYRGREGFASSTGEDWQAQLEQLSTSAGFSPQHLQMLSRDRYRRDCEIDIESLIRSCETWIRSLPRSYVNVSD